MARESKLVDPVSEDQERQERNEQEEQVRALNIEALSLDDFQPVPMAASKQTHPFEGYPQKRIKIGTHRVNGKEQDVIVNATHIVALNPKQYVHQDPSGLGITIQSQGQEKIVDYRTAHNRIVRDEMGRNIDVVFDREIVLGGGQRMKRCSICPDHTARAQIVFTTDPRTGKVSVDNRYVLADIDQVSRLRRCFDAFHYQQTRSERLSRKFDEEAGTAG